MTTPLRTIRRWCVIALLGLGLQLAVLQVLVALGVNPWTAAALAVACAILNNYMWHERWTWRHRYTPALQARLERFARFTGASAVVSLVGTVTLTGTMAQWGIPLILANVLAVVSMGIVNFVVADRMVFGDSARTSRRRVRTCA